MRFLENGENVVFLGPPGVGKTHLASALGLAAAQHRFSTCYVNCHQLIEQLKLQLRPSNIRSHCRIYFSLTFSFSKKTPMPFRFILKLVKKL